MAALWMWSALVLQGAMAEEPCKAREVTNPETGAVVRVVESRVSRHLALQVGRTDAQKGAAPSRYLRLVIDAPVGDDVQARHGDGLSVALADGRLLDLNLLSGGQPTQTVYEGSEAAGAFTRWELTYPLTEEELARFAGQKVDWLRVSLGDFYMTMDARPAKAAYLANRVRCLLPSADPA